MTEQKYSSPPILEAVIEFRWEKEVETDLLHVASKKLVKLYPHVENEISSSFTVEDMAVRKKEIKTTAKKFTSETGLENVILRPSALTVIKMAPYDGWESFVAKAKKIFIDVKKATKIKKLSRCSVRFINRIDIPTEESGMIDIDDYLTISVSVPKDDFPALLQYKTEFNIVLDDGASATVKTGSAPPEVLNNLSIWLDIDVIALHGLPQKEDQIWEKLEALRGHKNKIFETIVTDKTRALFSSGGT